MLLLPTVNALRKAHNASVLQESTLFTPTLDVELPELPAPAEAAGGDEPFPEFAARLKGQHSTVWSIPCNTERLAIWRECETYR